MTCVKPSSFPFATRVHFPFPTYVRLTVVLIVVVSFFGTSTMLYLPYVYVEKSHHLSPKGMANRFSYVGSRTVTHGTFSFGVASFPSMLNAANIMSGSPWVGSLCALNWGNDIRYRNGDVCYEPEKAVLFLNMATMRSFSSLPFDVLLRVFRELDIVGLIALEW